MTDKQASSFEQLTTIIDAEIYNVEGRLRQLQAARDALAGGPRLALPAPSGKAKKPPEKKQRRKKHKPAELSEASTLEPDFEINGVDIFLTPAERNLYDIIDAAPEGACVSIATIKSKTGQKEAAIYPVLRSLREKLSPAKCTVENVRGEGYRLSQL